MTTEPLPPHDVAAEESVLGSLIVDGERISEVADLLRPEHFFREHNGLVYAQALALYARHEAIDQVTLARALQQVGQLDQVGGVAYLSSLAAQVPTSLHIEDYARSIVRAWTYRQMISLAGEISRIGYAGGPDEAEALTRVHSAVLRLAVPGRRGFRELRELLDQFAMRTVLAPAERAEGNSSLWGTGFRDLDRILGGLHPMDLVVLGARPGMGKSALAMAMARHMSLDQGARVAVFSLEMAGEQIAERMVSSESGVDNTRVRLGRFNEGEERAVMDAMGVLSEAAVYVDDTAVLSVADLRARALQLAARGRVDCIMVDYMQLLNAGHRVENRTAEVTLISQALKALAREMHVPVLAVAQLSRAVEHRADRTPQLSDLRESGAVEQDADVVLLLHREAAYWTEESWHRSHPLEPYPRGISRVLVAKHRNGPTGEVKLYFREHLTKFENMARPEEG